MFDPVPPGMPAELVRRVLGMEGLLWTEYSPQETVERKTFPRLCAVSEVAWSPSNDRDWPEFEARCVRHCDRLRAMGVDVGPMAGEETATWTSKV
jgi:hexosaminidase